MDAHPPEQMITPLNSGVQTRYSSSTYNVLYAFVSLVEPKNIKEALLEPDWIAAMQEELEEFKRNDVWRLVPKPDGPTIIGTRWGLCSELLCPDIVFAVSFCARFQTNPREAHLTIVKRIFRYLKCTNNLCLWYPKHCEFTLVGFTDAYFVSFHVDRKSTSVMAQFLGPCLVSWGTRKQNSISMSSTEAEYIAAASCCT